MDKASAYGAGDCRFESYQGGARSLGGVDCSLGGLGFQGKRLLSRGQLPRACCWGIAPAGASRVRQHLALKRCPLARPHSHGVTSLRGSSLKYR